MKALPLIINKMEKTTNLYLILSLVLISLFGGIWLENELDLFENNNYNFLEENKTIENRISYKQICEKEVFKDVCSENKKIEVEQPNGLNYHTYFQNNTKSSKINILRNLMLVEVGGDRKNHTYSMNPVISDGDWIIEALDFTEDELLVGNIIVFKTSESDSLFVHRIIEVKIKDGESCYITKGDNNSNKDVDCVIKKDIRSVVLGVLYH